MTHLKVFVSLFVFLIRDRLFVRSHTGNYCKIAPVSGVIIGRRTLHTQTALDGEGA